MINLFKRFSGKPDAAESTEPPTAVEEQRQPAEQAPPPAPPVIAEEPKHVAASDEPASIDPVGLGGFELREATEEELAATFWSDQDFADIARVMPRTRAGQAPAPASAPVVAPPPAPKAAPVARPAAVERPNRVAPPPARPAAVAGPSGSQQLVGFWDGLAIGKHVQGWAGDPDSPAARNVTVSLLVDGKMVASARADGNRPDTRHGAFLIPFTDTNIAQYLLEERVSIRASVDGKRETTIVPLPPLLDIARDYRARELERAGVGVGALPPAPKQKADLTAFFIPVGTISPNNAAITGKDGYLFAYRGKFDIVSQYEERDVAGIESDVQYWLEILKRRQEVFGASGITYVQTLLPEKATILRDFVPGFGEITPRLKRIESRTLERRNAGGPNFYCSLVEALRACHAGGFSPFYALSDNLRPFGAQLCFYQLIQTLAAQLPARRSEFETIAAICGKANRGSEGVPIGGELASQFRFPMYELKSLPDVRAVLRYRDGLEEKPNGDDRLRAWENPSAPAKLRVLLLSPHPLTPRDSPNSLSWWFQSMFSSVHQVVSRDIDRAIVDETKPDVIFCIGRERELKVGKL